MIWKLYAIITSLPIAAFLDEGFHLFECFLKYNITNPTMAVITTKTSMTTMMMPAMAPAVIASTGGGKCDVKSDKRGHFKLQANMSSLRLPSTTCTVEITIAHTVCKAIDQHAYMVFRSCTALDHNN